MAASLRRLMLCVVLAVVGGFTSSAQAPSEVVLVAGTNTYHLKGCSEISGYSDAYLRSVPRSTIGVDYTACSVCRPNSATGVAPTAALPKEVEELWSRYDATETVALVLRPRTTGLYHRRGCHWLQGGQNQAFSRKDADARHFQAHLGCMKRPPDTFTQAAEDAMLGKAAAPATPARGLISPTPETPVTAPARVESPRPASPVITNTARPQCAATTKKGTRCSRLAAEGAAYCWQHR